MAKILRHAHMVCSLRDLCWLATCSSIFSMKETDSDKVVFIRVVALSLIFPMVCGSYFSDFSTESCGQNTKVCLDGLMLKQVAVWANFGPFTIGFESWVLHEHCSPMSYESSHKIWHQLGLWIKSYSHFTKPTSNSP